MIRLLETDEPQRRARDLEGTLVERLESLVGEGVVDVRVHGLWAGIDLDPALGTGRDLCDALAPAASSPRTRTGRASASPRRWSSAEEDLVWGLDQLADAIGELADAYAVGTPD